jgi:hypothetical protein
MTSDWLPMALIIGGGVLSVLSAVLATFLSGRHHRRGPQQPLWRLRRHRVLNVRRARAKDLHENQVLGGASW